MVYYACNDNSHTHEKDTRMITDLACQDVLLWALGYNGPKFHAMIADPPSGIGFLNQKWDTDYKGRDSWIAIMQHKLEAINEHLLPGAHCIIWALPRTSHWTATALENSGLEIRDIIHHSFGEGFPKSNSISAKIDQAKGVERTKGARVWTGGKRSGGIIRDELEEKTSSKIIYDTSSTVEGQAWVKHGTALKPAIEHWIIARKKITGTTYENCLEHGTGALDLETTRIGNGKGLTQKNNQNDAMFTHYGSGPNNAALREANGQEALGRWPSNLVLTHSAECTDRCADDCPIMLANEQPNLANQFFYKSDWSMEQAEKLAGIDPFFYCAKPKKTEKEAGIITAARKYNGKSMMLTNKNPVSGYKHNEPLVKNFHPTIKPLKLTKYLASLLLPPAEYGPRRILNPFSGSGSEMIGAMLAGWERVTGIERDQPYAELALQRIEYWKGQINV